MSVVPHSLPDTLSDARTAPQRTAAGARAFARECGWLLLAAVAAAVALTLFVRVTEYHTGDPLADLMLRPINLLRLAVMTGCLGLWSYILRSARRVNTRTGNSDSARSGGGRAAEPAGRG